MQNFFCAECFLQTAFLPTTLCKLLFAKRMQKECKKSAKQNHSTQPLKVRPRGDMRAVSFAAKQLH